jgi:calcium-dependent protein kinase
MGNLCGCFKTPNQPGRDKPLFDESLENLNNTKPVDHYIEDRGSRVKKPAIDNFVKEENIPIFNKYREEKLLAEGSLGKVFKMINKVTGEARAVKCINKRSDILGREELEKVVESEIEILKKIDHPNILKLLEFFNSAPTYYLVTEYLDGGELFDHITDSGPFDEQYVSVLIHQILSALNYCHKMHLIHRDLKPENIIFEDITKKRLNTNSFYFKTCNLQIKIVDFGCAKIFSHKIKENEKVGSHLYHAPEVISGIGYDEKCDLWSVGILMHMLLTGLHAFLGKSEEEIISNISKNNRIENKLYNKLSSEAKDLINSLLETKPGKRPTAEQALNHKWFKVNESKEHANFLSSIKVKKLFENIKAHERFNILQDAALGFLVHQHANAQGVVDARKLFSLIDRDNSGKITKKEFLEHLQEYFKSIGEDIENLKEEVETTFSSLDANSNGTIEYNEFLRAAVDKEELLNNEHLLLSTFHFFDKDRSGNIDVNELHHMFGEDSRNVKEFLEKILHEIDVNGDDRINFMEFSLMMKSILNSSNNKF